MESENLIESNRDTDHPAEHQETGCGRNPDHVWMARTGFNLKANLAGLTLHAGLAKFLLYQN